MFFYAVGEENGVENTEIKALRDEIKAKKKSNSKIKNKIKNKLKK